MTDNHFTLFCLVDGLPSSRAFPVKTSFADSVSDLKDLIKAKHAPVFDDIPASQITLWRVSIAVVAARKHEIITLDSLNDDAKEELVPTNDMSNVFETIPPKRTIHIIVQRPPPVHTPLPIPVHALTSTPFSDDSRPDSPLSGKRHCITHCLPPIAYSSVSYPSS
ncbi:hypothetical protein EDD21DRAFT_372836 [Dissophora ornata]|nr:hypothetical protein EDD21DRAFT_372836 [Dissophora ornata]